MKQITEDYCSFEIAQLLKEKGFKNEYCDNMLLSEDGDTIWKFATFTNRDDAFDATMKFKKQIPYVTHQMALKWLREVHNQIIIIKYGNVGFVEESILQWWWELLNTKGELHACNIVDGNKSYEEACEDSILYVLKNLI